MWLRAKGVDPNKHPILKELDRIKAQFAKVQAAERAGPCTFTFTLGLLLISLAANKDLCNSAMKLDKDASARLLRQPLKDASQPSKREQQLSDEKEAGTSKAQVPDIGKGTRFNAVAYHDEASKAAQAKVDARQEAAGSSDSDDGDDSLQVFDDDSTAQQQSSNDNPQSAPGSNAASGAEGSASANADKKKRKRRRSKKADAGGQTAAEASSAAASGALSSSASTKASKNKKKPKHA